MVDTTLKAKILFEPVSGGVSGTSTGGGSQESNTVKTQRERSYSMINRWLPTIGLGSLSMLGLPALLTGGLLAFAATMQSEMSKLSKDNFTILDGIKGFIKDRQRGPVGRESRGVLGFDKKFKDGTKHAKVYSTTLEEVDKATNGLVDSGTVLEQTQNAVNEAKEDGILKEGEFLVLTEAMIDATIAASDKLDTQATSMENLKNKTAAYNIVLAKRIEMENRLAAPSAGTRSYGARVQAAADQTGFDVAGFLSNITAQQEGRTQQLQEAGLQL